MVFLDRDIQAMYLEEGVNLIRYARKTAVFQRNDAQKTPADT